MMTDDVTGSKNESIREQAFEAEKFYKVKWTQVPDLVEKWRVFLKAGWAYVPGKEQSSTVFQEFEVQLTRALKGFLAGALSEWVGLGETTNADSMKAEMVDDLAKKHFPMYMQTMHDNLQRDHHIKHFGHLNYGLFLKVLGVPIKEAVVFWRKSFDRITDDKFNKDYKYNICHSFGLEGKHANYAPKSCQQLLMAGPLEYGCPYRHYSPKNLQSALLSTYSSSGLTSTDLPEIMATVKGGHYHVACTRVFEMTHHKFGVKKGEGAGGGESITHPNQYALRSMELYK
ncbi:hypothetical protein DXG01_008454 [Tephrocybe rancida]|nr:hypothetical protein DXG01_008454 [Tephrocybe rancida]